MATHDIAVTFPNGETIDTVVDESDLRTCYLCGNDLYLHDWIMVDAVGNTVECDRCE